MGFDQVIYLYSIHYLPKNTDFPALIGPFQGQNSLNKLLLAL